jgi:polyhydroxybutyrate depolymerase
MRRVWAAWIVAFSVLLAACAPAASPPPTSTPNPSRTPTLTLAPEPTFTPLLSPTPRATSAACQPGTFDLQLRQGKVERRFRLHIPPAAANPAALIIAMHGLGGNSADMEKYSGLSRLADAKGFIVAYPQATQQPSAWDLQAGPNPDVDFIDALIGDLLSRCPIDPLRVYAAGHSRGGGMADRLACNLDRRIRAIAGVAGAYGFWTDCAPARPVAVLAIHGLKDTTVPYVGRPKLPGNAYSTPPLPEWAAAWAKRNGCAPDAIVAAPSESLEIRSWGSCKARAEVVLYTLADAGHEWPELPVNASQLIWDFFTKH